MRRIAKKVWPAYFEKVLSGEKRFELRLNDFEVEKGDVLVLEEWGPETGEYTGRKIEKTVGYVMPFKPDDLFWSKEEVEEKGLQIISLEEEA